MPKVRSGTEEIANGNSIRPETDGTSRHALIPDGYVSAFTVSEHLSKPCSRTAGYQERPNHPA